MMSPAQHADPAQPGRQNNASNVRLAWVLAAIVALLYIGGLFIQRG